jgi:hypothetical protein
LPVYRVVTRASYIVLRLAFIAVRLKITNRYSGSSRIIKNMAPIAGRNIKSIAKADLVLASGL